MSKNPLINISKITKNFANSQIQVLLDEVQKQNPAVLGRILQLYQKPRETLLECFKSNPQMQLQINTQMENKTLKQQQVLLVEVLQNEGVDVRQIAANFGINL